MAADTKCGHEVAAPFDTVCTVNTLSSVNEYPAGDPHAAYRSTDSRGRNAGSKGKATSYMLAVILVISGTGIMLSAVVLVEMDVDYRGEGFLLENNSLGAFRSFQWSITDENGNTESFETGDKGSIMWTAPEHGEYEITLTGWSVLGVEYRDSARISENGTREYTVSWSGYSVNVSMTVADYLYYEDYEFETDGNYGSPRWPGSGVDEYLLEEYMTTDSENGTFEKLVDDLKSIAPTGTMETQLNFLMGFVQSLNGNDTYKTDADLYGIKEHWTFPMETLYNKGGDCEDLSMLLAALCREFFDGETYVALVLFWGGSGHAICAVNLDDPPLVSGDRAQDVSLGYVIDGRTYYTCETTSTGWRAGQLGSDYSGTVPDDVVVVYDRG